MIFFRKLFTRFDFTGDWVTCLYKWVEVNCERFTRAGEACTSDRQPVNGNPDSHSYSNSCLCERSLRETTRRLQFYRKSLALSLLVDQRKLVLWLQTRRSCIMILRTLSILNRNDEFVASCSKYLGGSVSADQSCDKDIQRRIGLAAGIVRNLDKIWKAQDITKGTKVML